MYNRLILFLLIGWIGTQSLMAEETITVAITPSTPWVSFDSNVSVESRIPSGFSIDLWTSIAKELNVQTRWLYQESTAAVFQAVKAQQADVGLVNFPPSTTKLGLQVMVLTETKMWQVIVQAVKQLIQQIPSRLILIVFLVLLGFAIVRWILDRFSARESRQFSGHFLLGVYDAFWWNIILLLGWENEGGNRTIGKIFDLAWHLLGLLLLGTFMGMLTASFTLESVEQQIKKIEDIDGKQVAVLEDAPYAQRYLQRRDNTTEIVLVKNLQEAAQKLINMEVNAVVHKGIELEQLAQQINKNDNQVRVLPQVVNQQQYAVVVPNAHPHADSINTLLTRFDQPQGLEESLAKRLFAKWKIEK